MAKKKGFFLWNFFAKAKQQREHNALIESIQIALNDLKTEIGMRPDLPSELRLNVGSIDNLQMMVENVRFEVLYDIKGKLTNLKRFLNEDGMQNSIMANFSEISDSIYTEQDYENISEILNVSRLQARINRIENRLKQLSDEIVARGGIQKATEMQHKEWNHLQKCASSLKETMSIANAAWEKEDAFKRLKAVEGQIKYYDPKYKFDKYTKETSIDALKAINIKYQAYIRKVEQDEKALIGIGGGSATQENGWINPPMCMQTNEPVVHTQLGVTNSTGVESTVPEEETMKLRELNFAANEIEKRLQNCSNTLAMKYQERAKQDELMKALLLQYKNAQGNPAEQERLQGQIHSLDKQRTALRRILAMFENTQSQLNNIKSMISETLESRKAIELQKVGSLGISSIEGLAMSLKATIEEMNKNLKEIEMAVNVGESVNIDTGYSEEMPVANSVIKKDPMIDSLMDEFDIKA